MGFLAYARLHREQLVMKKWHFFTSFFDPPPLRGGVPPIGNPYMRGGYPPIGQFWTPPFFNQFFINFLTIFDPGLVEFGPPPFLINFLSIFIKFWPLFRWRSSRIPLWDNGKAIVGQWKSHCGTMEIPYIAMYFIWEWEFIPRRTQK